MSGRIDCWNLDHFAWRKCIAVFLREESLIFVLFTAAGRVWNVALFSSGRKVFCLYCLSPLDEFGTSCHFAQGGKTCLFISLDWTSCLTSCCSTNWNFVPFPQGKNFFYLYCLSPLDEFGTSCRFPQGGKTLFPCDRSTEYRIIFPPLDELKHHAVFFRKEELSGSSLD